MYGLLWLDNIWLRYNYLKIWNLRVQKNQNIEKIAIKVVQMKFLAMNITNQKWSFDIFTVENLQNIFMEHDLYLISYRFLTYKNNLGLYFWSLQCIFGYCYKYTLTT